MNPEAAQVIGDLILRACQSLDSAPVQMLEEEDVTTFFKIRAAYDELLKATHKHCRNYAPTYTFVADCLAAAAPQDVEQTVASINDYLAKSDFGNVIQSAKAISEQSLEVCTQVNSFIALLKAKYSADVYFTWSFLVNVLIMTAGVGAQGAIVSGAAVIIIGAAREADHLIQYRNNTELNKKLMELIAKLEHVRDSVLEIGCVADTYSDKLKLVAHAMGTAGVKKELSHAYIVDMCIAFEDLENALYVAFGHKQKKRCMRKKLENLATGVGLAAGVGSVVAALATSGAGEVASGTGIGTVIHVSAAVSYCVIM